MTPRWARGVGYKLVQRPQIGTSYWSETGLIGLGRHVQNAHPWGEAAGVYYLDENLDAAYRMQSPGEDMVDTFAAQALNDQPPSPSWRSASSERIDALTTALSDLVR
jgi:hypothetical protein